MRVVAFDCSTSRGSVAAVVDGEVVFREEFESPRGRGGRFFPVLDAAMRAVGGDLDRVAVGVGPGSYNGLRATVAAAAGLRLATGAELVGVESVRCLALPEGVTEYVAVGDARGGAVFVARVRERRVVGDVALVPRGELAGRLGGMGEAEVYAVGVCGEFDVRLPDAGVLAEVASREVGGAEVVPLYLKPACVTVAKGASAASPEGLPHRLEADATG